MKTRLEGAELFRADRQTDRNDDAKSSFSQFLLKRLQMLLLEREPIFLFPRTPSTALWLNQPPVQWVPSCFPGLQRPRCKVYRCPLRTELHLTPRICLSDREGCSLHNFILYYLSVLLCTLSDWVCGLSCTNIRAVSEC